MRSCGNRTPSPPTAWGSRACGRTPSPATFRSCWSGSQAADDEFLVRQLVQWHAYTRRRGLDLDLVILDERPGEAGERLKADLQGGAAGALLGKPGGVFVMGADRSPPTMRCCSRPPRGPSSAADAARWRISSTIVRRTPPRAALPGRSIAAEAAAQPATPPEGLSSGTASADSRRTVAST